MGNSLSLEGLFENIMFSFGPITSVVAAKYGHKTWLNWEIVNSIGLGVTLILKPDFYMPMLMNSPMKPYHYFLCAFLGSQLINIVLYPIFLRDSEDKSIHYGHHFARMFEHSLIVLDNLVAYTDGGNHWSYKYLCFGTSFALTHWLGNIYFLTQTPKPIKSDKNESRDIVSAIGKLDFYLCIMSGICLYAFPDRVNLLLGGAGTLNESYRSLTRSCGAFFLGTSLASLCMSEFKYLEDKRKFLLSRLCGNAIELGVFVSGYFIGAYSFKTMCGLTFLNLCYNLPHAYGYIKTSSSSEEQLKSN